MHGRVIVVSKVDEDTSPRHGFSEDEIFSQYMEGKGVDYVREIDRSEWEKDMFWLFDDYGYEKNYGSERFHRWNSENKVGFEIRKGFARIIYDEKLDELKKILEEVITPDDLMKKAYLLRQTIEEDYATYVLEDYSITTWDDWLRYLPEEKTKYEITQIFDYHI